MAERRESLREVYLNRKMAVLLSLGFASGLPYLMTQDMPKGWLSRVGVDVKTIGLFSLVTLPYTLKFLWAPVVDWYVPPILGPWLGRRRAWLVLTQVVLAAVLLAMAAVGPATVKSPLLPLALLAVVLAFASASQDIVADAYRTDVLAAGERGAGAAVFVMGYRLAWIATGWGALQIAGAFGWRAAFAATAGVMLLGVVATLYAPAPEGRIAPPRTLADAVTHPLAQFFRSRGLLAAAVVLAFVFLFKLPEEMAKSMEMPLLLQKLGLDEGTVGRAKGAVGAVAVILGALAGGGVVARLGLIRSLWVFGILHAVSNLAYWLLIAHPSHLATLYGVLAFENFCRGLAQAGFVAFLMAQCDRRYSAFQYALLTSLMALTTSLAGAVGGQMVAAMGYAHYYAWSVVAGVPSLLLLPWVREPVDEPPARTCPACGYDLRGSPGPNCPECGVSVSGSGLL